jgi:hypothetical protein
MSRFLTPQRLDSLGGYKRPPRLSSTVAHLFHIVNTLRHSLKLPTSLLQALFKFKHPRRDLRINLEWPTRSSSQALHRRSSCVRYSWGFVSLDGLGYPGSPRLWLILESLYCPLLCGNLIVETELDLGDRSEWIRARRDLALCELHNGDVGILCGLPNFGKKSRVFVSFILIYFVVLFKICSCLELDLTLVWILEFVLLLVVPVISLSSILSSLLRVSLSGPRRIVLAPNILFYCTKFLVTGHIRPSTNISDLRPDISGSAVLTI